MNYLTMTLLGSVALAMVACTNQDSASVVEHNRCTTPWYEQVENQYPTGDGQGHGPDLGSEEWRSVVEFKLGIRGDEAVPAASSEQWCTYIDKHYMPTSPDL